MLIACMSIPAMFFNDLSGAFLGTELRDWAVYIRLPKDAGVHAGKILLLKKSVYVLKTSGRDFIHQLAE